ncbi:21534_t:CDS:2 [Dentiscutata erythropus]|uniref:21534_t:CDS:1 n=1 Tax=Dentiscutata erythropus TaxID=1348616 RepID=A0A9N9GHX2_9GLOM|nr:21534_t:CDS:2 [Dentiscutata erythropus]
MAFCEIVVKNQLEFFQPYLKPFTIQQHQEFPTEFPNKVLNLDLKVELKDNIVPIQSSIQNFIWTEDDVFTFDQYLRRRVIHLERMINDLDNNTNKYISLAKYKSETDKNNDRIKYSELNEVKINENVAENEITLTEPSYLKSLMNEIQNKIDLKINLLQAHLLEILEKQVFKKNRNKIDIKINSLEKKIQAHEIQNKVFCLNLFKEIQSEIDKKINLLVQGLQAQEIQDEINTNLVIKEIQNEIDLIINTLNQKLSANVLVKHEFSKLNKKIQVIEQNIEQELHNLKNYIVFTLIEIILNKSK